MKIHSEVNKGCTVLSLKGELTEDEVDDFRKKVLEQMDEKARDFVLDMTNVSFVDSKGLESLLWLQEQCIEHLGQVRLASCADNVNTILRITRLNEAIATCNSIQEAVDSLKA